MRETFAHCDATNRIAHNKQSTQLLFCMQTPTIRACVVTEGLKMLFGQMTLFDFCSCANIVETVITVQK